MDKEQALKKLRKLFRLSKSPNEAEAAAALRQAQKLMNVHGLTANDVAASTVTEDAARSGGKHRPPVWASALAGVVAQAFGCNAMVCNGRGLYPTEVRFIGIEPAPSLAGYAYTVLVRKLRRQRQEFVDSLSNRLARASKTRRGDLFAEAWVFAVSQTVQSFAGSEEQRTAIQAYEQQRYPHATSDARETTQPSRGRDWEAIERGRAAGKGVTLHRPMGEAETNRLEHQPGRLT